MLSINELTPEQYKELTERFVHMTNMRTALKAAMTVAAEAENAVGKYLKQNLSPEDIEKIAKVDYEPLTDDHAQIVLHDEKTYQQLMEYKRQQEAANQESLAGAGSDADGVIVHAPQKIIVPGG